MLDNSSVTLKCKKCGCMIQIYHEKGDPIYKTAVTSSTYTKGYLNCSHCSHVREKLKDLIMSFSNNTNYEVGSFEGGIYKNE